MATTLADSDFEDLDQITGRLVAFEQRYNAVAEPFDWTFSRDDLNDLLERIPQHDPPTPAALRAAA
jgi:hypothetical protein